MSHFKYCESCGNQIQAGAAQCPHCGKQFECSSFSETKFCQHCGEKIDKDCVVCPKCGKQVSQLKSEQPSVVITNTNTNTNANTNLNIGRRGKQVNKWLAFCFCLFLGWLGVHRFYEGKIGSGILYLFTFGLCGIGILVDLIIILTKPNPYYV